MRTAFWCLITALAPAAVLASSLALSPGPPGSIQQSVTAYLSGEGMSSRWHVVTSRAVVGKQNGKDPAYQWYVSVYAPSATGAKLAFQSPGMSGQDLLTKVEKANGAPLYFPVQVATIVGSGEFEKSGVQDAVIATHEMAADCGNAGVTVLGYDMATHKIVPRVIVNNGCDLKATIVKSGALQAIRLSGPYYNKTAAMCCPTKPNATALLSYRNGKWSVSPKYFQITKP